MWPFSSTQESEPAPIAAPPIDYLSDAHANLLQARVRLTDAERTLRKFNRENFDFVNGRRCLRVPTVNGKPDYSVQRVLESQEKTLVKNFAAATRTFQTALESWCAAKMEAK